MPSPQEDAKALRNAMQGFGCNDKVLIDILSQRTNEDLQFLKNAYHSEFGRDLLEDIKSETGGDFERILCALIRTRAEVDSRHANLTRDQNLTSLFRHRRTPMLFTSPSKESVLALSL